MIILSLDISSTTTGWAVFDNDKLIKFGKIKLNYKQLNLSEKLLIFKHEIILLIKEYKPDNIVIEDVFFGRNVKVIKTLAKFGGIAQECSLNYANVIAYVMDNKTTKSFFKVKKKKELYNKLCVDLSLDFCDYDNYNDIVDAYAQGVCYYNKIIIGDIEDD